MSKTMIQVTLYHYDKGITSEDAVLNTWIEKDPRIKKGIRLTLKDDDREWLVKEVYPTEVPFDLLEMNRNWDNNDYSKHDGTAMKKRVRSPLN